MTRVFLDTVGLLAIWDVRDQWHAAAVGAYAKLHPLDEQVTTSFVLLECANAAARHPYRLDVDELRSALEDEKLLVWPTADDWKDAWQGYQRGMFAGAGVVDLISISVMRRLGITRAFTNDRHFRAAGLETLF